MLYNLLYYGNAFRLMNTVSQNIQMFWHKCPKSLGSNLIISIIYGAVLMIKKTISHQNGFDANRSQLSDISQALLSIFGISLLQYLPSALCSVLRYNPPPLISVACTVVYFFSSIFCFSVLQ